MVFRVLNRLIGRTDRSELGVDAVNAYVEGSASSDEIKLVEQMMRENPALEKDLATQRTLLEVLDRVDTIEAPRSFAVTPEMVAAAERSESGLSRFAELFAPQRKLALAPAVIAGIAALSVALLTLGDITGVVDQDESSGNYLTTNASAPVAAVAVTGDVLVTVVVEKEIVTESGRSAVPEMATAEEEPLATVLVSEAQAPAVEPATEESALTAKSVAPQSEPEASAGATSEEPPSLAAAPPALATVTDGDGDEQTASDSSAVALEKAELDSVDDLETGIAATTTLEYEAGESIAEGTGEGADNGAFEGPTSETTVGTASDAGKGISLPLWQLQVALAALAVAAVGAWAGLRRVRGE